MKEICIDGQKIGNGASTYVIAEISANHNQDIQEAIDLVYLAKECGADAVKIQTYTPDTMTIDCSNEHFRIGEGTIWEGKNLYELYGEAYTPWEWTGRLLEEAKKAGITLFSSPFDITAVDCLEQHNMPAYKIASFELVDHPLIARIARTGKPVIMSTGMGSLREICEAVEVLEKNGCKEYALLKCTSSYPAPVDEANLARMKHMEEAFGVAVGLSDHTMGSTVPAIAVGLGAAIVEKHFTKSRDIEGPDSAFSMEPNEFSEMVKAVRIAEQAVGTVSYELTEKEKNSTVFRRSIFVVEDVAAGDLLTEENTRIIRPGYGLAPRYYDQVLGRKVNADVKRGTPLEWGILA
ncbi:pseudaminic acid synthase [Rubritalea tangerina]|uniref:Pseudaminic acid synthase n=1 Tax=Rubritalea tangerina TaxID=430798 RepID=A0ABW4ZAH5_9BACT